MEEVTEFETGQSQRPGFLSFLCVLSFIWNGALGLFALLGALAAKPVINMLEQVIANPEITQNLSDADMERFEMILNWGPGKLAAMLLLFFLLSLTTFIAVYKMWNLKKQGFIIYAAVGGIAIIVDLVGLNFLGAGIATLFIGLYALNRKYLK